MSGALSSLIQGVKDDPQECVEHGKQHPDIQPLYTRRGRQVVGHSNKTDQMVDCLVWHLVNLQCCQNQQDSQVHLDHHVNVVLSEKDNNLTKMGNILGISFLNSI